MSYEDGEDCGEALDLLVVAQGSMRVELQLS